VIWSRAFGKPLGVLAAGRRRARCTWAPRAARCVAFQRFQRPRAVELSRVRGGQGQPDGCGRAKLYFGDYGGPRAGPSRPAATAIACGWPASPANFLRGRHVSTATAAVAFGPRVHRLHRRARVTRSRRAPGKLAWAKQTGAYVVTPRPRRRNTAGGVGPTVYFGSYDGRIYAVNARSGAERWSVPQRREDLRPRRPSSARTVYFSDLGKHHTYGLNTGQTGHIVFQARGSARFDPVVSDGQRGCSWPAARVAEAAYIHRPPHARTRRKPKKEEAAGPQHKQHKKKRQGAAQRSARPRRPSQERRSGKRQPQEESK